MTSNVIPTELRCEYLPNPLGIDEIKPRLSWILHADEHERGQKQIAYQILIASSEENLYADNGDLWDSGRVESNRTNQIEYNGRPLRSRMRCYWKVRIWDKDGAASVWSAPAFWTMGLLNRDDWRAKWIGAKSLPITGDSEKDKASRLITASPLLRKSFLNKEQILRATMYVTALGLYEVRVNGVRVGDHMLAPEWTDYRKRLQYQTYDITNLIGSAENVVSATLADGWYIGPMGTLLKESDSRGKNYGSLDRMLLLQLELETSEGRLIQVHSDESWRINADGPVRSADIYLGEAFDSRKIPQGWENPGYDDTSWERASVHPWPSMRLVAQMNEPVRIIQELKPIAITEPSSGVYIFDMGQNMVGWCSLRVDESYGKEITLRHGEMLDETGKLYTANLRGALQTDRFIANGKGEQVFEPRFTYHGFRYVEITGLKKRPDLDILVGKQVSSAVEAVGQLGCSDGDLNRLWKNILWTQRDNLISIPTDCPQRDERLGWMADAQIFSQAAIFNCDMSSFYTKWTQDIRDSQTEDGRYPDVAPMPSPQGFYDSPAWADAGVIVPWRLYQNYADALVLRRHYASAKRFIDFVHAKNPKLIWTEAVGNQYGDWLNGDTIVADDYPKTGGQIPHPVFNTIHFASSTRILSKMANVLGYEDDARYYAKLFADIQDAFVKAFVDNEGHITGNTQAGYALALAFGLLPERLCANAFNHMMSSVSDYNYRISTGFLSTVRMMDELVRWGRADIAYQLLQSHRFPSWLYQIDQGATTIWERWDGYVKGRGFQDPRMNSFNHYAIGSVGEWMYRHILGIQLDEEHPGYREFVIRPQIGGSLAWVSGKYHSVNGDIVTEWKLESGILHLHVEIPTNTTARVCVPTRNRDTIKEGRVWAGYSRGVRFLKMEADTAVYEVLSGRYDFTSEYSKRELSAIHGK